VTTSQALELALQHQNAGQLSEAECLCQQVLAAEPANSTALELLAHIATQTNRLELAWHGLHRASTLDPNNPNPHFRLGDFYRSTGRLHEAISAYRRAIQLRPAWPEAWLDLGIALRLHGKPELAADAYRSALKFKPEWPEAHNNLGNALRDLGDLPNATIAYLRAVELKPNYSQAHNNLGAAFRASGQLDRAIASYQRALELQPNSAHPHYNLGNALKDRGLCEEAIAAYQQALNLAPDFPDARNNLAHAFWEQGRLAEAVQIFRHALALHPGDADVHSNLILALHHVPDLPPVTIVAEQARWNRRFSDSVAALTLPHASACHPKSRLRIGYVSADFCDHVVGRNVWPLFRHHDHQAFEIVGYSGSSQSDEMAQGFRGSCDLWRSTVGLNDVALANLIRDDQIDILVDLSQHTRGNRLRAFALRPAPVQVSFAGYPESTGLDAIPFRLSDRWLEPSMTPVPEYPDSCFPNPCSGVYLLDSFWCYAPCGLESAVSPPPALTSGHITFGSLNGFRKIHENVLRIWGRVVAEVPDSHLLLLLAEGAHQRRVLEILGSVGLDPERVDFLPPAPRNEYLGYHCHIDIALDPFPYNGHSTSLDALWMGVPVITLVGQTAVSRGGMSILNNLGHPEFVARSTEEYITIATTLARDLPRLSEFRAKLRPRMEASLLMDAPRFARQIETAWRTLWRHWRNHAR
jgi:predicted O-linked N-acetylglucosamine transferase (SPINDLY family)